MGFLIVFAFLSGLITIAAPCIWPLLPIILSATTTGGKSKPLGITIGIISSFGFFTLFISYLIKFIPFDPNGLRLIAVLIIGFSGLTLIIPALNQKVEGLISQWSSKLGVVTNDDTSFVSGLITGFALGIVWSPCAGPILATIASLAATQAVSFEVIIVTIAYLLGVGIPLFIFALLGNKFFSKSRLLNRYTGKLQQVFGCIMIVTAIVIFTNYDKVIQVNLLNHFPSYSNFLNSLEGNKTVTNELDKLKGSKNTTHLENKPLDMANNTLPTLGPAPEFTGIIKWLNLDGGRQSISMKDLKGKVVLIDFWTYTCINCIRTLPHVTAWYDKYKDKGFVVVGVHTPEFEFEKNSDNVNAAIKQYNIHYPVSLDNDYKTWNAYSNQYWPAEYLIDANGMIRRTHFGEGEYDETELAIQKLLEEKGVVIKESLDTKPDSTPHISISPETYLGSNRMERIAINESPKEGKQVFTSPKSIPLHYFSFSGTWDIEPEYSIASKNSKLSFEFSADKVFLVIHPKVKGEKIKVILDGKVITNEKSGSDVIEGEITVDEPRLYNIIDLKNNPGEHTLQLQFENEGTMVFAFTFG